MKMSKPVLLILAISTLLSTKAVKASFFAGPIKDIQIQGAKDVYSGIKFQYLDREDRLLILKDFLKTVELEYALLPLKEKRIGLDFNKLKYEAIALENAAEDVLIKPADRSNLFERERVSFLQAKANMEFLDRMRILVAQFKDTHFSIKEKFPRPFVYTGLRLFRIDGKIVVGSIEKELMAMTSELSRTDFSSIAIGDEVLTINGKPVEERVNELKKYVSGSSEEYIDYSAVRGLTIRNYNYDARNSITITFKKAGAFKFPLFANRNKNSVPRLDAITYFNKLGIPSNLSPLGMSFSKAFQQWIEGSLPFEGYTPGKLHLNLIGLKDYKESGDDDSSALRTGYYINKGKTYGVLQILTLGASKVTRDQEEVDFLEVIRAFVTELKAKELPLILDLRANPGGTTNLPGEIINILAKEKINYPRLTKGIRVTSYMRQLEEPKLYQDVTGENLNLGISNDEFDAFLQKTIEERRDYTPMYIDGGAPYNIKKKVGFDNKIVALVTANCVSACDIMAFLLKSSKLATIIGTHSNGTGAGFRSTTSLNTNWEDPLRVFSTQIPNFLFGVPGESVETKIFDDNSVETMCSENRPTMADVQYSPTMLDVEKNSIGWLQKAEEVIYGAPNKK